MQPLSHLLAQTDIYLIDQILKQRYLPGQHLLDAGCGSGRNLHYFLQHPHFTCYACDASAEALQHLQQQYPQLPSQNISLSTVEMLPYPTGHFHHIICSAVLHFATGPAHFFAMMQQLSRVLMPGGSLFIRMASIMGLEPLVTPLGNGRYHLPDDTERFLLTPQLLQQVQTQCPLSLAEPLKTTNVANLRCMSTLLFIKNEEE